MKSQEFGSIYMKKPSSKVQIEFEHILRDKHPIVWEKQQEK